jgi:hypothetical protein
MMDFMHTVHSAGRHVGHTLSAITESTEHLHHVRKSDVRPGDCLIVKTRNSTYMLKKNVEGDWLVSGGWFDRKAVSPARVRINGCTWGGCIIKVDIVAACGLCLEFNNRVTTSPIREIIIIPAEEQN